MNNYVVGFLFNKDLTEVVLIRKEKPPWQKGRWNGVGGKVEAGETPAEAMEREFEEETGKNVPSRAWLGFGRLHGPNWQIYLFAAAVDGITDVRTVTSEPVERWRVIDLQLSRSPIPLLGNIRWMLAMAKSILVGEESCKYFDIEELR